MERRTAAYVYGNTARPLRSEPLRREEIEKSRRIRQRPNPQRRRKAKTDKVAVFLVVITFTLSSASFSRISSVIVCTHS